MPETVARVLHILLFIGATVILCVWQIELHQGVITPWDIWMEPLLAVIVGGTGLVMVRRPDLDARLRPIPVSAFNLYLIAALHLTLLESPGPEQWYQTLTTLYWVPLAYGCAFVFLTLPVALVVCSITASAIFVPMVLWWHQDQLPTWTWESGPLLVVIALSHAMYVLLLWAVVKLRDSHADASASAERMRTLAATDVLTGLPNRRSMLDTLHSTLDSSRRADLPLAIVLVDADHFKAVNDRHGHAVGDAVLIHLGALMRTHLRSSDTLARWGGEEFLICAPGTPQEAAREIAERVREAVASSPTPHGEPLTVSLGVAVCRDHDDVDSLLLRADRALYTAKSAGRDRVVLAAEQDLAAPGDTRTAPLFD
ncbi:GGDEF domain-containing protein [Sphaerotilus mobilis]|uniref:diguanylate cyclase n=1 Tax=Sphaerotilus mobilis TaxID=47994 RepID=A0A4Q7LRG2_9BURK|nr:GGDEF domain-containing protein [Sphaerotilus mobilis]RZS56933.1 diguanylate cyclase (GGDEF)-like protein [Sphaerotilus mobilis]